MQGFACCLDEICKWEDRELVSIIPSWRTTPLFTHNGLRAKKWREEEKRH